MSTKRKAIVTLVCLNVLAAIVGILLGLPSKEVRVARRELAAAEKYCAELMSLSDDLHRVGMREEVLVRVREDAASACDLSITQARERIRAVESPAPPGPGGPEKSGVE